MFQPVDWVPLRWPSGPAAAAALKTQTQDETEVLMAWHKPEALSLIANSPVNCLVVTWANGTSKNEEQQATLRPLIDKAKQQGLAVVGSITADHSRAVEAAKPAGLDGILTDKPAQTAGLVVIPTTEAAAASKLASSPIVAVSDGSWPHIPPRRGGSGAGAGPTGVPWIDANGWLIQLARAKAPGRTIWVPADPTAGLAVSDGSYAVAVADAEAYSARWIVSLQPGIRRGLLKGESNAGETWRAISGALEFFHRHKGWRNQIEVARFGVISDFSGENRFMAQEVLNLAARRPLPYRIIDRVSVSSQSLAGLKAAVWVDAEPPDGDTRKLLISFIQNGGLLLAPSTLSSLAATMKPAGSHEGRHNLYASGKGRLAIAAAAWSDPFVLAADAHLLMSRKYDVLRAWNGGTSNFNYTATRDGESAVVQIVNYTGRPTGGDMSLYVAQPYKTAVLHRLTDRSAEPLKVTPKSEGVEVYLPPFVAYAAVEYGA